MMYKILFPTGYQVNDVLNDNIDIHVITETSSVFFGTLFTIHNIKTLTSNQTDRNYFWATDMIIVKDLEKQTIKKVVDEIITDGYLDKAFTRIGNLAEIYAEGAFFEKLEGI